MSLFWPWDNEDQALWEITEACLQFCSGKQANAVKKTKRKRRAYCQTAKSQENMPCEILSFLSIQTRFSAARTCYSKGFACNGTYEFHRVGFWAITKYKSESNVLFRNKFLRWSKRPFANEVSKSSVSVHRGQYIKPKFKQQRQDCPRQK